MAIKLIHQVHAQAITNAAGGTTIDPLLRDIVNGVEAAVAPDIVLITPKATALPMAVVTPLAAGGINMRNGGGAPGNADVCFIRLHSIQRVLAGAVNKYTNTVLNTAIANGAGTAITPALMLNGAAVAPNINWAVPKAIPAAATGNPFSATVIGTGAFTLQHAEVAPVNMDVLSLGLQSIFSLGVGGAPTNATSQRNLYLTVNVNAAATIGAIYTDNADATRIFQVMVTKVTAVGTQLNIQQIAGAASLGATGTLNLSSGTGDAAIAWTVRKFEKLLDVQSNVAVPNGAGLVFDPGLVVDGVPVMPDMVIVLPKATATVPFCATDLNGAVGNVTVQHNAGGPISCDILCVRWHSIQRVGSFA